MNCLIFIVSLLECRNGFFGKNCGKECGHCLKMEDCNPFNGTCLYGCSPGFKGELCNESMNLISMPLATHNENKMYIKCQMPPN